MRAAYAAELGAPEPLDGLVVGERPEPEPPPGWEVVSVRAASLNHHDVWTLRGVVGVPFEPPVILGCDAAGVTDDGREVIVHSVLESGARFRMLTDGVDGSFAPRLAVPSANLIDKPPSLSFEQAACLPTAWLTAWTMLFEAARVRPGERVLVQGATGGLPTAAICLATAAGADVTATSRSERGREFARSLGADAVAETGARLAEPVHVVIETTGQPTWRHSVSSLGFGGRLVTGGATGGRDADAEIRQLFWKELTVAGVKMGTIESLRALARFVAHAGIDPPISDVFQGVDEVPRAMAEMIAGRQLGKLVIRVT